MARYPEMGVSAGTASHPQLPPHLGVRVPPSRQLMHQMLLVRKVNPVSLISLLYLVHPMVSRACVLLPMKVGCKRDAVDNHGFS